MKQYFSQFGEDKWIVENLKLPEEGFFVDVGASDGVFCSNTLHFEMKGWSGICIEPDRRNYMKLDKIRSDCRQIAISDRDATMTFNMDYTTADFSGLIKHNGSYIEEAVTTKRLDTLFKEESIRIVDLLSIDTEGTELEVLKSFDILTYKPSIIIVEYLTQGIINKDVVEFFNKLPYKLVKQTEANFIYTYDNTRAKEKVG